SDEIQKLIYKKLIKNNCAIKTIRRNTVIPTKIKNCKKIEKNSIQPLAPFTSLACRSKPQIIRNIKNSIAATV
ncbi:hypothetical protein, partial [Acinetobacter faecalis]|uniref:hypothetical protein n=1 Tax=Acinetobacter faecalis TaxID=2665161 RepID=UPI002A90F75B